MSGEPTAAAVLVPLFRDTDGELRLVLVRRGAGGIHGGQLGLPGGKREPGDATLFETALREAEEEIGLSPDAVELVAELDWIDTRVSDFRVHPFLARIRPPGRWSIATGEIEGVLTPTVASLADRTFRREHELQLPRWRESRLVDGLLIDDTHLLWGFTLGLLDPLLPRILAGEWAV